MTTRPRTADRLLPVDRIPDHATKPNPRAGHSDDWMAAIPRPPDADRDAARAYLRRRGHADLLDVLGLTS